MFNERQIFPEITQKQDKDKDKLKEENIIAKEEKISRAEIVGEKAPENFKSRSDVVDILKNLPRDVEIVEIYESDEEIKNHLKKLYQEHDNFFVRAKIEQILTPPLNDWTISEKRLLIKNEWSNITSPIYFSKFFSNRNEDEILKIDPSNPEMLEEGEVKKIFDKYREILPQYFYWQECLIRQDKYNERDISNNYNVIPLSAENEVQEKKINDESCYNRLCDKYAVIYTLSGEVDSFFELNQEREKQIIATRKKYGLISEEYLEYIIASLEKGLDDNHEYFLDYFFYKKLLPRQLTENFEKDLNIKFPEKLMNEKFETKERFNETLEIFKNDLFAEFEESNICEKFKDLKIKLEELMEERRDAAKEKYFGFASENIELLDFFNSFVARNINDLKGRKHFSICYYLNLRESLPKNLVNEFEEKFNITIPENLKKFATTQEYFDTPDNELLKPFEHIIGFKIEFEMMTSWLSEKIKNLSEKIKDKKIAPERLSLDEILEKEGFKKDEINKEQYEKILLAYKFLIELPTREKIEKIFKIELNHFNIREQMQFLNFISSKTEKEVEEVKEFLNQSKNSETKHNRIKSFLSLEAGEEMGEKILSIGKKFGYNQKAADSCFTEYSRIIDGANKTAEELCEMYNEMIFEKKLDINEVSQLILRKGNKLLINIEEKLTATDIEKAGEIVQNMIAKFKKDEQSRIKILKEFKEISLQINILCEKVKEEDTKIREEDYLEYLKLERNRIKNNIESAKLSYENSELENFDEDFGFLKNGEYSNQKESLLVEQEFNKFDSYRIKEELETIENMYADIKSEEKQFILEHLSQETLRNMEKNRKEDKEKFEPLARKLKTLLNYRINFEKKLENLIFGKESAELPADFIQSIEQGIKNYNSEIDSYKNEKYYLPVGISSKLPNSKDAHLKPIDALSYMFWAKNQKIDIEFMVCDTIQETNYQILYGLDMTTAREKALENGIKDKEWYSTIKNIFSLDNIKMIDYQEMEQNSTMAEKLELINSLEKENPIFTRAFEAMAQESVRKKSLTLKKEKLEILKEYAKNEVAFILAKNETKIGHKKEFKYDILARIIPVYEELKKHIAEIPQLANADDENQALIDLTFYLSYQHNFPPSYHMVLDLYELRESEQKVKEILELKNYANFEKKEAPSKLQKLKISAKELQGKIQEVAIKFLKEKKIIDEVEKNMKNLGLVKNPKQTAVYWRKIGKEIAEKDWFKKISLPNFHYVESLTNLSFELKDEDRKETTGFREFYSTYTGASEEEISFEANQVIASTNPMATVKILCLSGESQKLYAEKIIKPLLVNYYIATSKSNEEAIVRVQNDMKKVETISDAINLIQEKIIWPIEMELKARHQEYSQMA
ncbi:MAG: hypothetical protein V1770_02340 [bacterium]